ncbi:MAG: hypothetical protein AB1600_12040 [Bacteroidota bacterium]
MTEQIEELTIYFRKQHRLKFPHGVIAATAYRQTAILVTNITKDFKNIPEVQVETPQRKK